MAGVLAGCRSLTAIWEHATDLTAADLEAPGPTRGAGFTVGVNDPTGPARPGPRRPRCPPDGLVLHAYRHHQRPQGDRGGRQDHVRSAQGRGSGAAPPGRLGPRHGRRTIPAAGGRQVQPEVPALRVLLEPLDPGGVVVTTDAMHTQVDTAQWIRGRGGHYVLTSLDNQKTLRRTLKALP